MRRPGGPTRRTRSSWPPCAAGTTTPSATCSPATSSASPPTWRAWSAAASTPRRSPRRRSSPRCAGCVRPSRRSPSRRGSTGSPATGRSTTSAPARAAAPRSSCTPSRRSRLGPSSSTAAGPEAASRASRHARPAGRLRRAHRRPPPDPHHARARGPHLRPARRTAGNVAFAGREHALPRPPAARGGVRRAGQRRALQRVPELLDAATRTWATRHRARQRHLSHCQHCRRAARQAQLVAAAASAATSDSSKLRRTSSRPGGPLAGTNPRGVSTTPLETTLLDRPAAADPLLLHAFARRDRPLGGRRPAARHGGTGVRVSDLMELADELAAGRLAARGHRSDAARRRLARCSTT